MADYAEKLWLTLVTIFACFCIIYGTRKNPDARSAPDVAEFTSGLTLDVEHSLDTGPAGKFTVRGVLSFKSFKHGVGSFTQTSALNAGEKRKLKELAKSNGLYRIRVPTTIGDQVPGETNYVSTFTKACTLVESRLSDEITIHLDQANNVLGISIVPLEGSCHMEDVETSSLNYFNTTVSLSTTVPGPVPDTQAFVQKLEEEKIAKAKGNTTDNRSFFAKYWMYIVPIMLFVMLSSGGEQRGGGGGS
ncbi:ER membrane protein complex subunit 10-like [Amphiura filiformis]|uniref:ER membrane protein complex subunit 10-like n=1 Tax=Amphiura filiformis TaxID=82378 RepID=UPI003B213250